MNTKKIFEEENLRLKENKNNIAILVVGSASDLNFDKKINDIDLFIIIKEGEKQIREIKYIDDIEFDINYFPISLAKNLIESKEQFFIESMSSANLIYDNDKIGENYLKEAKIKYENGPQALDMQEIINLRFILLDNVKRVRNLEDKDWREVEFLSSLYLRDVVRSYFSVNNKWIPKDKNLFKILKEDNIELYEMSQKLYINYNPNILEDMINYIFKDVVQKDSSIKIIY